MTPVLMVVWNHIREHWLLITKGQKISLGKYQQFVYAGLRTHHLHSLKGFFFAKVVYGLIKECLFRAILLKEKPPDAAGGA